MKKSFFLGLLFVFSCSLIFAQKSINSYKYILIPKQYEFLKSADKYQVNSLTKFLFEKAGFTALFTDDLYPDDLAVNRCLALNAMVVDNSGMFSTKMKIRLTDCNNAVVYESKDGRSKEKEYKTAYHEAIRAAFKEIEELAYSYDESLSNENKQVTLSAPKSKVEETAIKKVVEKKEVVVVTKPKKKRYQSRN